MKYLRLIWRNLTRKKVRTTLTIGSYAVALFLFGLLATIHTAFNQGLEVAGADRLITRNKISLTWFLPYSYRDRIARIPGVRAVTFAVWFGGVYQDERNFFPQLAVDKDSFLSIYPEFKVPKDQWAAFCADREGCIVGRVTAEKFGFKLGDRIPLKAPFWGGVWDFNVRGIYDGSRSEADVTQMWIRYDYWQERNRFAKGSVGWYVVRVEDPDRAPQVVKAIDDRFANSSWETKTDTEKAFAAGMVKQVGNIELLILAIGGVVFFTLLLVTGNTMAMAVRERTGEFAVLKTLGFSDGAVLGLVLAESALISIQGGIIGLAGVKLFTLSGDPTHGLLPLFYLEPFYVALGLAAALLVGLASGMIPALLAMRLRIVDALRRV